MNATVTFTHCIQDSQDYGSDNEHMVSRVFFDLDVDGHTYPGLYADLKQVVGSNFESGDIEVGRPEGYTGPFNHIAFRDAAENYYRSLIGSAGSVIRIHGSTSIRMRNNIFERTQVARFKIAGAPPAAW